MAALRHSHGAQRINTTKATVLKLWFCQLSDMGVKSGPPHSNGRTQADGVSEKGAEGDIWD